MSCRIKCSKKCIVVYQLILLTVLQQANGFINSNFYDVMFYHDFLDMKHRRNGSNKVVSTYKNENGSPFFFPSYQPTLSRRIWNCNHPLKSMTSNTENEKNHNNDDDNDTSHNNHDNSNSGSGRNNQGNLYFDPESLEEIKQHADIISVIESHNLPGFERLSSTRATALCPFHDDTNPSLSIDNNRGLYKCFACGAGGDVFNFIREYRHLEENNGGSQKSKMSFVQAVNVVIREFLPQHLSNNMNNNGRIISSSYSQTTPQQREKFVRDVQKMERIHLANAAACDFYSKALVTLSSSGAARNHLRMRGIHPSIVSTFALGYAPDAYYSNSQKIGNTQQQQQQVWGQGSLVEKLQQLNFSPQEIIDAGLAIRLNKDKKYNNKKDTNANQSKRIQSQTLKETKNNKNNDNEKSNTNNDETNNNNPTKTETDLDDYSILMDRFRGRLMIPIFDKTGTKIIAFGGRHLENPITQQIDTNKKAHNSKTDITDTKDPDKKGVKPMSKRKYVAAKYMNSPESLVFQKKNVLFGLNAAKKALNEQSSTSSENPSEMNNDEKEGTVQSASPLIIVEGYMDAITLYAADVKEVVASMGTALTVHQLEAAAECVNPRCSKFFPYFQV